jgi:hypothetical protein
VQLFERTTRRRSRKRGRRPPKCAIRRNAPLFARLHLARLGRDRNLAIVFQVELRQSVKFMERLSSTLLRDYLGHIRSAFADGQAAGVFRDDFNPPAPRRCSSGRWMKWRPTGSEHAAVFARGRTPDSGVGPGLLRGASR